MNKGRRTGITMNKKLGSTLIAMTIIIFMLFLTLGMFTKNFGGSASAEIAKPYASVVGYKLNNADVDEGDSGTYIFAVNNTKKGDGSQISEVAMSYSLHIDTTYDGNVDYKLYQIDEKDKDNPDATGTEVTVNSDGWYEYKDNNVMKFELKKDSNNNLESQTHYYKLVYTPENDGELNFKVQLKAQQID